MTLRNHLEAHVFLTSSRLPHLVGDYRLTFTAANSCSQLPPSLRTRTFQAAIRAADSPAHITIALAGPDVLPGYATFSGSVAGDLARLSVFSWDAFTWWLEDLPIIERLRGGRYVAFSGFATLPVGRAGAPLAGTFDGTFSYCSTSHPPASPNFPPVCSAVVECAGAHEISLTPQF
jgi:hypothetical protein